jgi:hypothetical protein
MAQRSETVLNDWAAGFTAREISTRQKIPLGSVTRYIVEARRAGDPRAALRNASPYAPNPVPATPRSSSFVEIDDDVAEEPCRLHRNCDAAALAALFKVHGDPSRVKTLAPAPQAFTRPDNLLFQPRGVRAFDLTVGDPPPGRSALGMRRVG